MIRSKLGRWTILVMTFAWAVNAWAQPSRRVDLARTLYLPDDPAKNVGFECEVHISNSNRPGYDTVELSVKLPVAATTERQIVAQLSPVTDEMAPQRNVFDIELPFRIEQGKKQVKITRYVPKWTFGNSYLIRLSEGSRALEAYRGEIGVDLPKRRSLPTEIISEEVFRKWLLVSQSSDPNVVAADIAKTIRELADPTQQMALNGARPSQRVEHSALTELPTDWRAYDAHDCVLIDAETFLKLRTTMPDQFTALNRWLMFGGTLILRAMDDDSDLATLLGHSSQAGGVGERALMGYGVGAVFSFRDEAPMADEQWKRLNGLLTGQNSPALRRGVDPLFGDTRFRRWLIPGVAQPPVYTFMGLLTLFVILVGPVAYRMTTRQGRGYLMFAIAPVLAILTTLSMFAYGIVADGFGTVARIRQITWIDGTSGDAVTRTRGTYFAGIRPADGLRFDADAEVLWYPDSRDGSMDEMLSQPPQLLGTVTINELDQRFSSSFLPSRQQRQFIVHQAIENAGSLVAIRSDEGAAAPSPTVTLEVHSDLSMDLSNVAIRDSRGELWNIASLPANSVVTINSPVPVKERSKLLGDLYNVQRMMEEVSSARRYQPSKQSYDLLAQLKQTNATGDQEMTDGRLENWLRNSLQLGGSLPNGSYIGLATIESRFVAVESAKIVDSVHFVFGTMPGTNFTTKAAP